MSCKKKNLLAFSIPLLFFPIRIVILYFAIYFFEDCLYADYPPPFVEVLLLQLSAMAFLWIDYFLIRLFYRKNLCNKCLLNLVALSDALFYFCSQSMRIVMLWFCVATESGYWVWNTDFVVGIILLEMFKFQLIFTKYRLVVKNLRPHTKPVDIAQMILACVPVVNWLNFPLRILFNSKKEDRRTRIKKDAVFFIVGIVLGTVISVLMCCIYLGGGMLHDLYDGGYVFDWGILGDYELLLPLGLDQLLSLSLVMGLFFLPYGTPMLIDLFMLQHREKKPQVPDGVEDSTRDGTVCDFG